MLGMALRTCGSSRRWNLCGNHRSKKFTPSDIRRAVSPIAFAPEVVVKRGHFILLAREHA